MYRITGWVLSKGDISIEVVNRDNKKVDYTYVKCDRHDLIDNGYTEDKEKSIWIYNICRRKKMVIY